jgi:hypothetical protein
MDSPFYGPQDANWLLQASTTLTASGNGTAINPVPGFAPPGAGEPMVAVFETSAISGTSPTFSVVIQDSPDGVTWTTRSAPLSITQAGPGVGTSVIGFFAQGQYFRYAMTIGGTSPSITFSAYISPFTLGH